jgi:hypothetical protein
MSEPQFSATSGVDAGCHLDANYWRDPAPGDRCIIGTLTGWIHTPILLICALSRSSRWLPSGRWRPEKELRSYRIPLGA